MAQEKKKGKRDNGSRIFFNLSLDTQKSIIALFFFFISIFLILALLRIGGKIGEGLLLFLEKSFGIVGTILMALFFFLLGLHFLLEKKIPSAFLIFLAGMLIFVAIFTFLGMLSEDIGGVVGKTLGLFFKEYLGLAGAAILNLLFFLLAISLILNLPLSKFITKKQKEKVPLFKEGEAKLKIKEIIPKEASEQKRKWFFRIKKDEDYSPRLGVQPQKYKSLPFSLLEDEKERAISGNIRANASIIKKTFATFGISVEMGEVNVGPTVTQYTLKPAEGVKLSRITALQNDLALTLASHPIRIEAPIPGRSLVGIEVPNKRRAFVKPKSLLSQELFLKGGSLTVPLGKDVKGTPVFANISTMPHLLVAGATGSGKTVFLNSLIISLIWKNSPQDLRFILIDPKRVEFNSYADLPHLLSSPIIQYQKVMPALKWLIREMERRFEILHKTGHRDIFHYHLALKKENLENLPYIVLIVDELADIIAARGKEFEALVVRLAQMSRAVGIHLVLATQRPSVEILTGLIKANITSRVAFQVASQVDSRTILDMGGAERLLGAGDMLFLSAKTAKPKRIQAPFVSTLEIKKIVDFVQKFQKGEKEPKMEIEKELKEALQASEEISVMEIEAEKGDDELYEEAKKVVARARKASASLLQRRLKIGYARAARLLDMLEERGVIGPSQGAKPREVYLKTEDEEGLDNFNLNEKEPDKLS